MSACRSAAGWKLRNGGFSLVELMIALTLGLILMSGVVLVYLESRRQSVLEAEAARLQQAGRYALALLQHELLMAGFHARLSDLSGIPPVAAAPDCGGLAGWALEPLPAIDMVNQVAPGQRRSVHGHDLECLPAGPGSIAEATDILVVKRSAAAPTLRNGVLPAGVNGAEESQWYLRINEPEGRAAWRYIPQGGAFGVRDQSPGSGISYWETYGSIFFVRPWSQSGDGVPTLCVERLSANSMGPVECLVEGVEDLQLSFGVDSDRDRVADRFSDNPGADELNRATVARVALLLRSLGRVPGLLGGDTSGRRSGLDSDGYLRQWFSATVNLPNHRSPAGVEPL